MSFRNFFISLFDFAICSKYAKIIITEITAKIITPKPIVDYKKCIKCGKCKVACPAKVIQITQKGAKIDLKKCIRCYCCHELCPKKAIHIKQNIFFKLVK